MLSRFVEDDFQIPVCIADLPAHDFQVSPDTLTESVVAVLEETPDLPGVLLVEGQELTGFLTRLKLFERLAHRYGIELFMRKPIRQLAAAIPSQAQPLSGNLRVDEALRYALNRLQRDMYDPLVVELKNKMYRILDMNVLVLAQSQTVTNLSNVVGKLGQIDTLIHQDWDKSEILERMLRLLGQVVPYHQAQVLVRESGKLDLAAAHGCDSGHKRDVNSIQSNPIYQMMLKHRQIIYLPDTSQVPAWQDMEVLGQPASWLGVPLLDGEGNFFGFLSLGRNVDSPFSWNEKQTCQAFAQRMAKALQQKEKKKDIVWRGNFYIGFGDASPTSMEMFALSEPEGVY